MDNALELLRYNHEQLEEHFGRVSDPDVDRVETLTRLIERLAAHISAEQTFLLPLLGHNDAARGLKSDYREMGRLLLLIERRKGNSPDLPDLVTDLRDAYHTHTKRYDQDVLPILQASPVHDLEELEQKIESAESVILSHPHPGLLRLGPLSRFSTRVAAVFDRARDKTSPVTGLRRVPH